MWDQVCSPSSSPKLTVHRMGHRTLTLTSPRCALGSANESSPLIGWTVHHIQLSRRDALGAPGLQERKAAPSEPKVGARVLLMTAWAILTHR
jgi:hypothetical protein